MTRRPRRYLALDVLARSQAASQVIDHEVPDELNLQAITA
jgi:hypothetical protein